MIRLMMVLVLISLITPCDLYSESWKGKLTNLLSTDDIEKQETLIKSISAEQPSYKELEEQLIKSPEWTGKPGHHLLEITCLDGKVRPYCLYVPDEAKDGEPKPLIVWLHGGVTREELKDNPLEYAEGSPLFPTCKKMGWFCLSPFGQKGAAWWDKVGMTNILSQIAKIKENYNIDDDRVSLCGFSDGASAAFCLAMVKPSVFSSFVALNGHMGVGSLDGDLSTYVGNMAQTPIYAVTTDNDPLYPTKKMHSSIAMAQGEGALISYRSIKGTHTFDYGDSELPRIISFLKRSPRNPIPCSIDWEAASKEYGRCHWLIVKEPAPHLTRVKWHRDANLSLISDGITIGYHSNDKFEGKGDEVKSLAKGDTLARQIGLKEGDIIVGGGEMKIEASKDLWAYKATLKRGGPVNLSVMRNGEKHSLEGNIPSPEFYYLFKRQRPSARVRVHFLGDRFTIESSMTASLRILLNAEQIEPGQEIKIIANGKELKTATTAINYPFLLNEFLKNRDRKAISYGYIDIKLED